MAASPFVFIASPVSSQDAHEVLQRIESASKFGAWLQEEQNKCPFVAAAHDMAINKYLNKPKTSAWWKENIKYFMDQAESCSVLCLDGWENSSGVKLEIEMARKFQKPIFYYEETDNSFRKIEDI